MTNLLAKSLGAVLARVLGGTGQGMKVKLLVPAGLRTEFLRGVVEGAREAGALSFEVSQTHREGAISPGEAIKYRGVPNPVLIVSYEASYYDLTSLDPFADIMPDGLPGDMIESAQSLVTINEIASEIARRLVDDIGEREALDNIRRGIVSVSRFLCEAYEFFGNAGTTWRSAFWRHLDEFVHSIPTALTVAQPQGIELPTRALYPAAGLPLPNGLDGYSEGNDPIKYAAIISKRWADTPSIESALIDVAAISANAQDGEHPLATLDWSSFPLTLAQYEHPVLSVCLHERREREENSLRAWLNTEEDAFFRDVEKEPLQWRLERRNHLGDWEELPVLEEAGGLIFVTVPELQLEGAFELLADFQLVLGREFGSGALAIDDLHVSVSPKAGFKIETHTVDHRNEGAAIKFSLSSRIKIGQSWPEKPIKVTLEAASARGRHVFPAPLRIDLYLNNPTRPSLFVVDAINGRPKLQFHKRLKLNGDQSFEDDGEAGTPEITLSDRSSKSTLFVFKATDAPKWLDSSPLTPTSETGIATTVSSYDITSLPDDSILGISERFWTLSRPEQEGGFISPIHAWLNGSDLRAPDEFENERLSADPRARLENWMVSLARLRERTSEFESALGSCVVSLRNESSADAIDWNGDKNVFTETPSARLQALPSRRAGIPSELLAGFWEAFDELDLFAPGRAKKDFTMSGIDLREIPQSSIEKYLNAYERICQFVSGQTRSEFSFASAYPFSAHVYSAARGKIVGVLLSPFHPIRLSWNWSAQLAAAGLSAHSRFSKLGSTFVRFLDGEDFPIMGPSLASMGKGFLSEAMHHGPDEFFAAWSLLSSNEFRELCRSGQKFVLGNPVPLGAPSGLDPGNIRACVQDYLANYPLTSQMTIEISASGGTERYSSTDDAIVIAARNLLSSREVDLPGGIRVLDGPERPGTPPRPEETLRIFERAHFSSGFDTTLRPFQWSRALDTSEADIVLKEDAPVEVELGNNMSPDGVVLGSSGPRTPITRFKAWMVMDQASERVSTTSLGLDRLSFSAMKAFGPALSAFEGLSMGEGCGVLNSQLMLTSEFSGKARWIVTGSRYSSPAAMSATLAEDDNLNFLLWEWRPAFLARNKAQRESGELASSHPYTVLAELSEGFISELGSTLTSATVPEGAKTARAIVRKLGTRGVGLVSLLASGHSQVMGSIGFYLAYKLLENWERNAPEGVLRCIVPMDAPFPFLEALGTSPQSENDTRKHADLLLFEATLKDGIAHLLFQPIEVKAYGATDDRIFPDRTNVPGLDQLAATATLLGRIENNLSDGSSVPDLVLAGFASLIEACLALKPRPKQDHARLAASVLGAAGRGAYKLFATKGSVLYFQANGRSGNGESYDVRLGSLERPGQLVSSIDGAFSIGADAPVLAQVDDLLRSTIPKSALIEAKSVSAARTEIETPEEPRPEMEHEPPHENRIVGNDTSDNMRGDAEPQGPAERVEAVNTLSDHKIHALESARLLIGERMDGGPVYWDLSRGANPELPNFGLSVSGDAGQGKTSIIKAIAAEAAGLGCPILIFDFKDDFTDDFATQNDFKIIDLSEGLPFNPLRPPPHGERGAQVYRHIYEVTSAFQTALSLGDQQVATFRNAIEDCYYIDNGESPKEWRNPWEINAPSFSDVIERIESEDGSQAALLNRLALMRGSGVIPNEHEALLGFSELMRGRYILRFKQLPNNDALKSALAELILIQLQGFMLRGDQPRALRRLLIFDEAWRAAKSERLTQLAREGRAFGVGVVVGSQFPDDLSNELVGNLATKLHLFNSDASKRRSTVRSIVGTPAGATATDLARVLSGLGQFEAVISNQQMSPFEFCRTTPYHERNT